MTWAAVAGSSAAVRLWRALTRGSAAVSALRSQEWLLGRLRVDVQRGTRPHEFDRLATLVYDSIFGRAVAWGSGRAAAGWRGSLGAAAAALVAGAWGRLEPRERIRLSALMLTVAVLTHLLLTRAALATMSGAPGPTFVARAFWAVVLVVLVTVMKGARQVAAAWADWTTGHLAGRMSGRT